LKHSIEDISIGVIGGSGLYEMEELENITEVIVATPYGMPSDNFVVGELEGHQVAFLARHGRGHKINPSNLPTRANIYGFKKLGIKLLLSASACGSMKEKYKPKDIVIIDQFIDRTRHRSDTFFDEGLVAHISFSDPICPKLAELLYKCAKDAGANAYKGGTYLNMEGPQFSTRAESNLYRSWGVDVIGMTNLTEARLAREAEICYATMALVTDYDCWYEGEEAVTVDMIVDVLNKNAKTAQQIIKNVVNKIGDEIPDCDCREALKNAIITSPDAISEEIKKKLNIIVGKYIK
jgi:5'-methylthioadenosine phosphorylase